MPNINKFDEKSDKIKSWENKIAKFANLIGEAKGTNVAAVLIYGHDEDYADVNPQLILEDALRVDVSGWPKDFSVDLLNPSSDSEIK